MGTLTTFLIPISAIVLISGYLYLKGKATQVKKDELNKNK